MKLLIRNGHYMEAGSFRQSIADLTDLPMEKVLLKNAVRFRQLTAILTYVFGGGPEPYDETGDTTAYVQCGSKVFTYAQSKHVWTGRSYPMELYL